MNIETVSAWFDRVETQTKRLMASYMKGDWSKAPDSVPSELLHIMSCPAAVAEDLKVLLATNAAARQRFQGYFGHWLHMARALEDQLHEGRILVVGGGLSPLQPDGYHYGIPSFRAIPAALSRFLVAIDADEVFRPKTGLWPIECWKKGDIPTLTPIIDKALVEALPLTAKRHPNALALSLIAREPQIEAPEKDWVDRRYFQEMLDGDPNKLLVLETLYRAASRKPCLSVLVGGMSTSSQRMIDIIEPHLSDDDRTHLHALQLERSRDCYKTSLRFARQGSFRNIDTTPIDWEQSPVMSMNTRLNHVPVVFNASYFQESMQNALASGLDLKCGNALAVIAGWATDLDGDPTQQQTILAGMQLATQNIPDTIWLGALRRHRDKVLGLITLNPDLPAMAARHNDKKAGLVLVDSLVDSPVAR